jgi:galactose oxidase-like protein
MRVRARMLWIFAVVVVAASSLTPALAAQDPKVVGRWRTPFGEGGVWDDDPSLEQSKRFPTAVSAVVLPDGRLLYWNGLEGTENFETGFFPDIVTASENSRARILDLRARRPRWSIPHLERGTTAEPHDDGQWATKDLFCADQKLLYDGTVLIAGGTEWQATDFYGDVETRVFDPRTDAFRAVGPMHDPRWYPSLVTLSDGRVAVASGFARGLATFVNPDPAFSQSRLTEIYDPRTGRWREAGMSQWSFPLYPRLHLMPDGTVFYGGAGEAWAPFGETADEATWALQRTYHPTTRTWSALGPSRYGTRSGATSTMLRLEPPYDRAEILLAGGTLGPAPGTSIATTLSEMIRWQGGVISSEGSPKGPFDGLTGDPTQLRNRRWFSTSVLLPTGEVLLMSGGDADDVLDPGSAAAVRMAELYDPETGEWHELSEGTHERVYHNSAVLLPDGRVLVGGHAPLPAHYHRHDNPVTRSSNYRDSTFEIYEPPYLFRGRRPVVASVLPADRGRALKLTLGAGTRAGDVAEVVLVRMSATTHTIDADMRAVRLEHRRAGSSIVAALPRRGDARLLPPGPYYVFAMRDARDGAVPSIAHVVLIQPLGAGKVVVRAARG